jgi:UDP-glucose 4-epimerase
VKEKLSGLDLNAKPVAFVAGGAGFVGSNLVRRLLAEGWNVFVADNFSLGSADLLDSVSANNSLEIVEADLSLRTSALECFSQCARVFGDIDDVWHLAANSDIPAGVTDPNVDLKDTFMTTFALLEACKAWDVKNFHFASSSAVYGQWDGEAGLSETLGPLRPISNYGAMKLASEAQISAACEAFLSRVNIFRFPNVIGTPATHGVIYDFVKRLLDQPTILQVLGNGTQQKSYLHVSELVDAMLFISQHDSPSGGYPQILNIGNDDDGVSVKFIAEQVVKEIAPLAEIRYGSESKGWIGDIPRFSYNTDRLKAIGWRPKLTSKASVERAVFEIASQLK